MKLVECSEIEADSPWNDMLSTLESFQTYVELESYILSLEVEHTKPMKCSVQKFKGKKHKLDVIAEISKHTDSPQNHSPVLTLGDGNCCPHSLSIAGFGDDSKHIQIRAKIVIESVINKEKYLNHEYLSQGAVEVCEDVTLPEIFTRFSGQNAAGLSDNIVESVYKKEIMSLTKKGSYMGMWQLFAAANVLAHPIRSIFPLRGSEQF